MYLLVTNKLGSLTVYTHIYGRSCDNSVTHYAISIISAEFFRYFHCHLTQLLFIHPGEINLTNFDPAASHFVNHTLTNTDSAPAIDMLCL